eukprot:m.224854 g.224854  ORF g.224854 m.224854 type:complete len:1048 (+) comp17301_c0_seq3:141-3284(+)
MSHQRSLSNAAAMRELEEVYYSEPVPTALLCLLCHQVFDEPVIATDCGHSFCRSCLTKASTTGTTCPKHPNVQLSPSHVIPNITVEDQVNILTIYCGNAIVTRGTNSSRNENDSNLPAFGRSAALMGYVSDQSCHVTGTLDEIKQHMQVCDFTPVPCPQSSRCGRVAKHQLQVHLASCGYTPCRYLPFGCTFRGTPEQVRFHSINNCEHSDDPLVRQGRLLQSLMKTTTDLTQRIQALQQTAVAIEGKQDALLTQSSASARAQTTRTGQPRHHHSRKPSSFASKPLWSSPPRRDSHGDPNASDDEMDSWNEQYYQRLPAVNHSIREATVEQHMQASSNVMPPVQQDELQLPFNFQCIGTLGGHKGPIWCLAHYEQLLFSVSSDETAIHVWDLSGREPKRLQVLTGHNAVIHCLHVDKQQLYSGDTHRQIKVWDLATMACQITFSAGNNIICGIVSTQELLIAASFASITVWNTQTQKLHTIVDSGLPHWVRAVSTPPDGELVLAATHNIIKAWQVPNFEEAFEIKTQHGSIHSMVTSRHYVIAGTYNRNIHVYSLRDRQHVMELKGHLGTVHSLSLSSSGRFLFSASIDTTAKIWDLEKNGLIIQSLQRHDASVNAVCLFGNLLLTGSADKTIKIFRSFVGTPASVVDPTVPQDTTGYRAFWGGGKLPAPPLPEELVAVEDTMVSNPGAGSGNNIRVPSPVNRRSSNISRATVSTIDSRAVDDGSGDSHRQSDNISNSSSQHNMNHLRGPVPLAGTNGTPPASRVRHTVLAPAPSRQSPTQLRSSGPTPPSAGRTWVLKSKTSTTSSTSTVSPRPARLDLSMLNSDGTPSGASYSPMASPRTAGPFAIGPQPQHASGTIAPATGTSPYMSSQGPTPQSWLAPTGYDEVAGLDRVSMRSNRSDRSRIKTPLGNRQDATPNPSDPIPIPSQAAPYDPYDGGYSPPLNDEPLLSQPGSATSSIRSVVVNDGPLVSVAGRPAWSQGHDPLLQAMEPQLDDDEAPVTPLESSQSHVSFVAANMGSSQGTLVSEEQQGKVAIVSTDLDETSMV